MNQIDCITRKHGQCSATSIIGLVDQSGHGLPQHVLCCRECGHGVSMPPVADVSVLYAGRDSQDFQPNTRGVAHAVKEHAFRRQARALLKQIGREPRQLLDYGCGSGQFTRILGELVPNAKVTGSDFFEAPPPELAGKPYCAFADLQHQQASFDVVTAFHVLEHDNHPSELLKRLIGLLRPGGTLVIEVPNIASPWARILGRHWDVWYLPFHRHHFTRTSLLALLRNEGLIIDDCIPVTVPSMGRTLANMLGTGKNLFTLLAGIALHPVQVVVERFSGEATAIRVIAHKE